MSALPVHQPDWIESAPLHNMHERRMAASPEQVWARIAEHETWPEWFTAIKAVRVTGEAAGVGGKREVSIPGTKMGEVFTVWEPNEQFAFAVVTANRTLAGMAESVALRRDGDGCVVTYRQGIEPARGFGWLWKLILPRMRSELAKALEQLDELTARG